MRLTSAQVDAFIADYESGMTVAAVAAKYNVSLITATAHLHRGGITIRRPRGIATANLPEAARLRAEGWTLDRIGERYGCSRTTVSNQLKAFARSDPGSPALS